VFLLNVKMCGNTDRGLVRDTNEDSFWYDENLGAAIVADGLGGARAGEVASAVTVDMFQKFVTASLSQAVSVEDVKAILSGSLSRAGQKILKSAGENPELDGMGSTAVCVCFRNNRWVIAHIGDSRAYLVHEGKMIQQTKDHSFVQNLLDRGLITPEQAHFHPYRNLITRHVGMQGGAEADFAVLEAATGDICLLCSDGLSGVLSDDEISAILSGKMPLAEKCEELIKRTLEYGAPDNITVVIAEAGE
jgi:PPM family protein phosphatase